MAEPGVFSRLSAPVCASQDGISFFFSQPNHLLPPPIPPPFLGPGLTLQSLVVLLPLWLLQLRSIKVPQGTPEKLTPPPGLHCLAASVIPESRAPPPQGCWGNALHWVLLGMWVPCPREWKGGSGGIMTERGLQRGLCCLSSCTALWEGGRQEEEPLPGDFCGQESFSHLLHQPGGPTRIPHAWGCSHWPRGVLYEGNSNGSLLIHRCTGHTWGSGVNQVALISQPVANLDSPWFTAA